MYDNLALFFFFLDFVLIIMQPLQIISRLPGWVVKQQQKKNSKAQIQNYRHDNKLKD